MVSSVVDSDITGLIGAPDRRERPVVPMFAFDRPSVTFWRGAYDGLREAGRTHEQALAWLQSRYARHAATEAETQLRALGREAGLLGASDELDG